MADPIEILLVANEYDPHSQALLRELGLTGARALCYNLNDFRQSRFKMYSGNLVIKPNDEWISISSRSVVWWHRSGNIDSEGLEQDEATFAHEEAFHLLRGALTAQNVCWIDDPYIIERADSKPFQLRTASQLGAQIPETLTTNDVASAKEFARGRRVIAKPISPGRGIRPYTSEVPHDMLEMVDAMPTTLQELVDATADLRVVSIGESVWTWRRPREP